MNELEESWNEFKAKLLTEGISIRPNDRAYFQSGFNAAVKLFRKPNITPDAADTKGRCICLSYHERTGKHVPDCPCR